MCIERPAVAISYAMREILQDLTCAIRSDARVLITGESGPANSELAGLIHRGSRRAMARFLTVDCGKTPDSVLEMRLFGRAGHGVDGPDRDTRGLLEQADGGTIFLASIGAIGLTLQGRLLRFLENGEVRRVGADRAHAAVDVRVLSSADRGLFAMTRQMRFREDLYYRLNAMHLRMPPVRNPSEDDSPISSFQ